MADNGVTRVKRDRARDLCFRGELIAEVDNREESASNGGDFTHLRLFRTRSGTFVFSGQHVIKKPGKYGRNWTYVCDSAAEMCESLLVSHAQKLLRLDKTLLELAAKRVPEFDGVLLEHID